MFFFFVFFLEKCVQLNYIAALLVYRLDDGK